MGILFSAVSPNIGVNEPQVCCITDAPVVCSYIIFRICVCILHSYLCGVSTLRRTMSPVQLLFGKRGMLSTRCCGVRVQFGAPATDRALTFRITFFFTAVW